MNLHIIGMFSHPTHAWKAIHAEQPSLQQSILLVMTLAALPAIAGFFGTTYVGWRIGAGESVHLTGSSAAVIAFLFYLVLVGAVFSIGWMIHWMGHTYNAQQPLARCVALATYVAVPFFLIGLVSFYPVLWLDLVLGFPALAYAVFLLYTGVPIMMEVSPERGFLYSSAVLAVGLIGLVGVLAMTAILWGFGIGPVFTGS